MATSDGGAGTTRRRSHRWNRAVVLVVSVVAGATMASCSSTTPPPPVAAPVGTGPAPEFALDANFPVALLAEPDGSLLFAERLTGSVRRMTSSGDVVPEPLAHLDVVGQSDDQRGVLGLARSADGRLFASWTRVGDGRLVVGQIDPGPVRLAWEGPVSADLANGGHLVLGPDGRLLIGIGDLLQDRSLDANPAVPNRKLLALDPDGPPDQRPTILSTGWNNPFAITVVDGVPWVADNSPGGPPERIGRGDRPADQATDLPTGDQGEAAPSALVSLGGGRLGRCGFLTRRMDEIDITATPHLTGKVLADRCSVGAAVLADGRLAVATPDRIAVVPRT